MVLRINDRLKIRTMKFFDKISVTLRYDAVCSTFTLSYFFDPTDPDLKDVSVPGHFHIVQLDDDNGDRILTGYITRVNFVSESKRQLVTIAGYSLPGVLDDCDIIPPFEFNTLSLKDVSDILLRSFPEVKMVIDPSITVLMEQPYEQLKARDSQTIADFIHKLTSQKNIVMTHNVFGNLVFTRASSTQVPIAHFGENTFGCIRKEFDYDGQHLHSDITLSKEADIEEAAQTDQVTLKNSWVPFVYRPKYRVHDSGIENDTRMAAINLIGQELKSIPMKITIQDWRQNGILMMPGKIVTVLDPKVFMYKKTPWMIESVHLQQNSNNDKQAILHCVPKEAYTGEYPANYPFAGINVR